MFAAVSRPRKQNHIDWMDFLCLFVCCYLQRYRAVQIPVRYPLDVNGFLGRIWKANSLFYFYQLHFFCTMTREEKNASMPNNSTHTSTPNCESVEILFGLTPHQIYQCFGCFYDLKRFCTIGLMEMLESIQRINKTDDGDTSVYIALTESVSALVEIDRMHDVYSDFNNRVSSACNDVAWLTDELMELDCVRKLHYHFMDIVNSVNKVGFMEFSTNVASSLSEITTKQAYEDMVYALACVYNIYTAYIKSMYLCSAQKCVTTQIIK